MYLKEFWGNVKDKMVGKRKEMQQKKFLINLIELLKKDAWKSRELWIMHKNMVDSQFYNGFHLGYYEVMSTFGNQLFAFQINKKEVKFDLDPDKDLSSMDPKKKLKISQQSSGVNKKVMVTDTEIYFLTDLITLLKEDALQSKQDLKRYKNSKNMEFYIGKLSAYKEVFSIMKDQLIAFNINQRKVRFDIDPDKDLLPK